MQFVRYIPSSWNNKDVISLFISTMSTDHFDQSSEKICSLNNQSKQDKCDSVKSDVVKLID